MSVILHVDISGTIVFQSNVIGSCVFIAAALQYTPIKFCLASFSPAGRDEIYIVVIPVRQET